MSRPPERATCNDGAQDEGHSSSAGQVVITGRAEGVAASVIPESCFMNWRPGRPVIDQEESHDLQDGLLFLMCPR